MPNISPIYAQNMTKICRKYALDMPKQGEFNFGPSSHPGLRIISSESGCPTFVDNRNKSSTKTLFLILLNLL